jgi:3-oxoacyl-[acyl-carrier protein] reductase
MSKDKILIIGASSDIGLDLIRNIDQDALIIAHYNSSHRDLEDLLSQIDQESVMIKADLSIEKETVAMVDSIEKNYGIPNKIIHLPAPKFENIRFKDIELNNFQNDLEVCLKSLIIILNKFLPKLSKGQQGKVVCMLSSVVLNKPPKALAQYTIIKYALLGLVKSLASEYSDKNIQINAISPSMCETKFLNSLNDKLVELSAYNNPNKRNAVVGDITPIIKMLISSKSDYISGVNIPVTGGSIF